MSVSSGGRVCKKCVLGGTFSLLHSGHRHFLFNAWRRCRNLVIGVTSDEFARRLGKSHPIEPYEVRALSVLSYLLSLGNGLYEVVPIDDPYGPAVEREDIDCIFVSEETFPGAVTINIIRRLHGLSPLKICVIDIKSIQGRRISSTLLWSRVSSLGKLRGEISKD